MKSHKIVRELFDLSHDERSQLWDILSILNEAEHDHILVGKEFTYKNFAKYARKYYESFAHQGKLNSHHKERLKIIEGDNLDKIEDAAKDKKLI